MDIDKHIENIALMEDNFDVAREALKKLDESIKNFLAVQDKIKALEAYYTSPQWIKDYEADENGELPCDLKRGVLSQDGVHNLLCENKALLEAIKQLI